VAGFTRLEEKHKRAVELVLRAVPREEIAEELQISRSTLFNWLKDPLIEAYYQKLVHELEAARKLRLTPTFLKAADVVDAALDEAKRQLLSDDPKERLKAPNIQTLANVLRTVYSMERTDAGAPTTIQEHQLVPAEAGGRPKRTLFEEMMDGVVVDGSIDVTPNPTEENS